MTGTRATDGLRGVVERHAVKLIILMLIAIGFMLSAVVKAAGSGQQFTVLVHASNPVDELSKKELSKLFLKKTKNWKNGDQVVPVDLLPPSSTRDDFSKTVHRKDVQGIRQYWRLRVFGFSEIPPTELATESEVLQFVSNNPASIGYVSADSNLAGYKVKVVWISD